MDETVEISLMVLLPTEYETLLIVDDGRKLTDLYPDQIYATIHKERILEVSSEPTDSMIEMFGLNELMAMRKKLVGSV